MKCWSSYWGTSANHSNYSGPQDRCKTQPGECAGPGYTVLSGLQQFSDPVLPLLIKGKTSWLGWASVPAKQADVHCLATA